MADINDRIKGLLSRFVQYKCTPAELAEVCTLLEQGRYLKHWAEAMHERLQGVGDDGYPVDNPPFLTNTEAVMRRPT